METDDDTFRWNPHLPPKLTAYIVIPKALMLVCRDYTVLHSDKDPSWLPGEAASCRRFLKVKGDKVSRTPEVPEGVAIRQI